MDKIALTTVSNDERYTKHLDLVSKAWKRLGYTLYVIGIQRCDGRDGPYEDFIAKDIEHEYVYLPKEMYDSQFKATYIQSLRFWAASNLLKGKGHIVITDADILPINRRHFTFDLAEGEIVHLNATPYVRFDKPQLPACYYAASYHTFHKYFPRNPDPIKWLDLYLKDKKEFGRDEYWASHYIQDIGDIRIRVIKAKFGLERYSSADNGRIPDRKIIDFHFPFMDNVEEIYNKLVEKSDAQEK